MLTLVKNGTVISPQNNLHSKLNIIIDNGKIKALTTREADADLVIDASGMVVSPGFVDIHMHEGDPTALECLLRQGVTSGLGGNCGENRCDPETFLKGIDHSGAVLNMGMLAGYGYYREKLSHASRYEGISAGEQEKILTHMQSALDGGCPGISFGLEYMPGITREEMLACTGLKGVRLISSHIRGCSTQAAGAISEMIDISKESGIPVQISHIGSMAGYGTMKECLELIEKAKSEGVSINCDCYPYLAYSTAIGSAVYDEGWMELMNCSYSDIEMCEGVYKGKRCTKEIFEEERRVHPEYLTVGHVLKAEDVSLALSKDYTALCSDAYFAGGAGHPRAAGAFAKYIHESRDLDKAIYKCSALPAKLAGFKNKGAADIGFDGDLVIFDPGSFRDKATFADPVLPPDGIKYVVIGGRIAVSGQNIQNYALGKAIYAQF